MAAPAHLSGDQPPRADHITAAAFKAIAALIHAEAGIALHASKQTMLEGRLSRRARALGIARLEDYCDFVLAEDSRHEELEHLINAVTTNKTDFFREPRHFDPVVARGLERHAG